MGIITAISFASDPGKIQILSYNSCYFDPPKTNF